MLVSSKTLPGTGTRASTSQTMNEMLMLVLLSSLK